MADAGPQTAEGYLKSTTRPRSPSSLLPEAPHLKRELGTESGARSRSGGCGHARSCVASAALSPGLLCDLHPPMGLPLRPLPSPTPARLRGLLAALLLLAMPAAAQTVPVNQPPFDPIAPPTRM